MNSLEIEKGTLQIYHNDKSLAALIEKYGQCRLKPHKNFYYALLKAIVSQQLSAKAADAIIKRFNDSIGIKPKPEHILTADTDYLRRLGISFAKIKYMKDLSSKIISGEIELKRFDNKSDEEIINTLTTVKGIGEWTAQMFLIFTLCRLNVLPVNDLGIRKAVKKLYGFRSLPDVRKLKVLARSNGWEPYNSIACWYLWQSLE